MQKSKKKKILIASISTVSMLGIIGAAAGIGYATFLKNNKQQQETQDLITAAKNLVANIVNEDSKRDFLKQINDPKFRQYSPKNYATLQIILKNIKKQIEEDRAFVLSKINQLKNNEIKNNLLNRFQNNNNAANLKNILEETNRQLILQEKTKSLELAKIELNALIKDLSKDKKEKFIIQISEAKTLEEINLIKKNIIDFLSKISTEDQLLKNKINALIEKINASDISNNDKEELTNKAKLATNKNIEEVSKLLDLEINKATLKQEVLILLNKLSKTKQKYKELKQKFSNKDANVDDFNDIKNQVNSYLNKLKSDVEILLDSFQDDNLKKQLKTELSSADNEEKILDIKAKILAHQMKPDVQKLLELISRLSSKNPLKKELSDQLNQQNINAKEIDNIIKKLDNEIQKILDKTAKNIEKLDGSPKYNEYQNEIKKGNITEDELEQISNDANSIFGEYNQEAIAYVNALNIEITIKNKLSTLIKTSKNIKNSDFYKSKAKLYNDISSIHNINKQEKLKNELEKISFANNDYRDLFGELSQKIDNEINKQNNNPNEAPQIPSPNVPDITPSPGIDVPAPNYEKINDSQALLAEAQKQISTVNEFFEKTDNDPELVDERHKLAIAYTNLIKYRDRQRDYNNNIDELNDALKEFKTQLYNLSQKFKKVIRNHELQKLNTDINSTTNNSKTDSPKHSLGFDLIFNKSTQKFNDANAIVTQTPYYKKKLQEFKNYLKTANNNTGLDLSNNRLDLGFLNYLKEVGIYGEYGDNDEQKWRQFFNGYNKEHMMKALFLDTFDTIPNNSIEIKQDENIANKIKGIIRNNPFGYLPSNLSQFLYYIDLDTIKKMIDFNQEIEEIKAKHNDLSGEITLLFKTKSTQFRHLTLNTSNSLLRKNDDFYQYIYDRSFSLNYKGIYTVRPPFGGNPSQRYTSTSGTAWIVDRIDNKITTNKNGGEEYEFLVATNAHVASLTHIFDKSIVYNKNTDKKNINNFVGRLDPNFNFNKHNYETADNGEIINDYQKYFKKPLNTHQGTDTKSQYLDWIYYTPRFSSKGLRANRAVTNFFDELTDANNRLGTVKNGGADFAILKLRFTKNNIRDLFPTLYEILDTPAEKDWYIGFGNETNKQKNHESPIQTHFVLGFPDVDGTIKLNAARSQGGYIETKNRVVDNDKNNKDNFNSLWVRYNEKENKDWNSIDNKWMDYEKPFGKAPEHGMPKNILQQMTTLYLDNEKNESLDSGSSGSMVIDSRFNLIGINFIHIVESDNSENRGNQIILFRGESEYDPKEFSGDIKHDFITKLEVDKLKTIKLNPKI
ncbi:MAG2960 family serine endopeptidase lipoprotein [Mycoplasma sp. 527]